MHYALIIALIISNIMTLLLGVIFSQSLGFGLGEIASLKYYRDIVKTQTSFARSTSLGCTKVDVRQFAGSKRIPAEKAVIRQQLRDSTNELRKTARSVKQKRADDFLSGRALQVKAQVRKQLFMELMHTDSEGLALGMLSPEDRSAINEIAPNCAETSVIAEGRLEIMHFDSANFVDSYEEVDLVTANGERMRLLGQKRDKRLVSDTRVTVQGLQLDNVIVYGSVAAGSDSDTGGISILQQPAISSLTTGEQTPLVVGVNFLAQPRSTIATSTIESAMNLVDQYYAEVSYGQSDFHGVINQAAGADFLGWFDLPRVASCSGTSISEVKNLIDPYIDFNDYSRLLIIGNYGSCYWAGLATSGEISVATQDGTVSIGISWIDDPYVTVGTIGHELGHNFGLGHASSMDCGAASIATTGCVFTEYGDQYDIMGSSGYRAHFNSIHKEQAAWFSPSNIIEVVSSGQYVLTPFEVGGSGAKALRIRHSQFDNLYAEYRQLIGFDVPSLTNTNIPSGALLHLDYGRINIADTTLIDASPPFDVRNPAIELNDLFVDPATGAEVFVVSTSSSALTLDVNICKTDFGPPSLTIDAPSASSVLTGVVSVSATASDASAGSGIDRLEFYHSDVNGDVLFASDMTVPYEAQLDTTMLADGSYWISVVAYDRAGASCGAQNNSVTRGVNVFVSNFDTEPPYVEILRPLDGSFQLGDLSLCANAFDNVGISTVDFFEDQGGFPAHVASTPDFCTNVTLPGGSHSIFATAHDFAGNSATSSPVIFTVDVEPPDLSIVAPQNGQRVKGAITVTVTASDQAPISSVSIILPTAPGQTWEVYWQGSSPFSTTLNTLTLPNGTYTIEARAFDFLGNSSLSSIQINVDNPGPGGGGGGGGKLQQRELP